MQATRNRAGRLAGFTAIELLTIVAIVGILAALLLPTISKGKDRAKRIACVHNLRQAGIAFHGFAHEHNGSFPMSVHLTEGGSEEYVQSGYQISGEFYFSYRHFQPLAPELINPRILLCPADTRQPALTFQTFSNQNLSYFVAVNSDFSKPNSVLAGDRNLTNDFAGWSTLVQLGTNQFLRWTTELHKFKGNVLFADGHVEELNSLNLMPLVTQLPQPADLVLPSVASPAPAGSPPAGGTVFPGAAVRPVMPSTTTNLLLRATNLIVLTNRSRAPVVPVVVGTTPNGTARNSWSPIPAATVPDTPTPALTELNASNAAAPRPALRLARKTTAHSADPPATPVFVQAAVTAARAVPSAWWWLLALLALISLLILEDRRERRARRRWLSRLRHEGGNRLSK